VKSVRVQIAERDRVYRSHFIGPGQEPNRTLFDYVDASDLGREIAAELDAAERVESFTFAVVPR
jgi:hypothetical protein